LNPKFNIIVQEAFYLQQDGRLCAIVARHLRTEILTWPIATRLAFELYSDTRMVRFDETGDILGDRFWAKFTHHATAPGGEK
jgi:hypothetical protein